MLNSEYFIFTVQNFTVEFAALALIAGMPDEDF
jgi:hypothetical protein